MTPNDFTWTQPGQCVPPQSCPNIAWFWLIAAALGLILCARQAPKEAR